MTVFLSLGLLVYCMWNSGSLFSFVGLYIPLTPIQFTKHIYCMYQISVYNIYHYSCCFLKCNYPFCLLQWFAGNYAYQLALSDTKAGIVNIISSASGLFTLILAAIFPSSLADKFTLSKLFAVMLMVTGVVRVSEFCFWQFSCWFVDRLPQNLSYSTGCYQKQVFYVGSKSGLNILCT